MTLEESSTAALKAVQAEDLDALAVALDARSGALSRGDAATPGIHAAGEITTRLLRDLIRDARLESARLRQWGCALSPSGVPSHVDLSG